MTTRNESTSFGKRSRMLAALWFDLHAALAAEFFLDHLGHYTEEGAHVLADRLRPRLLRELDASEGVEPARP
jgi:hypothetical protein